MRGGVSTLLGLLGGVLVLLGVIIGGILGGVTSLITGNGRGFFDLLYNGLILLVLGVLILAFTAYARAHPPPDKAAGGIIVLIVSAIAWFFSGGVGFLVISTIGAILGILAGILFLLESAFRAPPR